MRYLGLDLGTKTLGVAVSDTLHTIANPVGTIRFTNYDELTSEVVRLIREYEVERIALGLPKNMDGSMGFASDRSINFKNILEEKIDIPIDLVDERLSTVEAEKYMLNADTSRKKRKENIDAVAASVILDTYIKMKGKE